MTHVGAARRGTGYGPPFSVTLFNDVLNDVPDAPADRICPELRSSLLGMRKRNSPLIDDDAAGEVQRTCNRILQSGFYGCCRHLRHRPATEGT